MIKPYQIRKINIRKRNRLIIPYVCYYSLYRIDRVIMEIKGGGGTDKEETYYHFFVRSRSYV